MIGVPIHFQVELLGPGLRFRGWTRRPLYGMVECVFHIRELSPVATSDSTHAFFLGMRAISVLMYPAANLGWTTPYPMLRVISLRSFRHG